MMWFLTLLCCFADSNSPIVIAHRGASGYAVDSFFTDYPDLGRSAVQSKSKQPSGEK